MMKLKRLMSGRRGQGGILMSLLLQILISCSGNSGHDMIDASGIIEATEVNISSKVAGEILTFGVDEGSRVERGDTIAQIDHSTLDLKLERVEAGVEQAEAQLRLLVKGARAEDIQQAEESLRQAEANLKLASTEAKRMDELFASHSVTQQRKDAADAQHAVALAQYNTAAQMLQKIKKIARPEEIQAAEAQLKQAEASSKLLKKTISDCCVQSPVSGVVTQKPVEVGELVSRGAVLATVSELDTVNLMIYVDEIELGRVRLGQDAEVNIDTYPNRTFGGTVVYISPTAEFTPKSIQTKEDRVKLVFGVKIRIPNAEGILKPGMPADAAVRTAD